MLFFTFVISFFLAPLFMLRKHWEMYLLSFKNDFWFNLLVVQTDNAFWEEIAKLTALFIAFYFFKKIIQAWRNEFKKLIGLGYWIGISYGVGEAAFLACLMRYPQYSHYIGISTFGLFLTKEFIYERIWTIQAHGIMGGIIGIGFYDFLFFRRKKILTFLFLAAMFYHIIIDGLIVVTWYYPATIKFYPPPYFFTPITIFIGYLILFVLIYFKKSNLKVSNNELCKKEEISYGKR
jgi:hypothetical protein